jgi:hypothetical protein
MRASSGTPTRWGHRLDIHNKDCEEDWWLLEVRVALVVNIDREFLNARVDFVSCETETQHSR